MRFAGWKCKIVVVTQWITVSYWFALITHMTHCWRRRYNRDVNNRVRLCTDPFLGFYQTLKKTIQVCQWPVASLWIENYGNLPGQLHCRSMLLWLYCLVKFCESFDPHTWGNRMRISTTFPTSYLAVCWCVGVSVLLHLLSWWSTRALKPILQWNSSHCLDVLKYASKLLWQRELTRKELILYV